MRIESLIFTFQKFSWSRIGSHWGEDLVSDVERESKHNCFQDTGQSKDESKNPRGANM